MSKTLLRNQLDAALEGGLSLNEWRVFAVLLRQTLGFGKRSDPLTQGRISQLTGIRKDRIEAAINGIVEKGLFDQAEHKWLDHTYTVPARFFDGDASPRFFAPSAPLSGETPRPTGEIPHSAGTYRDITLTEINITDNTATSLPADDVVVCDDLIHVTEIKKPDAVDVETYTKLLPALRKLPNAKAAGDVLALLSAAMLDRSAKNPEKLGGYFIKCAREGTLDTSSLYTATPAPAVDTTAQRNAEMAALKREAAAITALYQHGNIAMPPHEAARIEQLAAEYQRLKKESPATTAIVPSTANIPQQHKSLENHYATTV
jgi:phage replication O-like protein O